MRECHAEYISRRQKKKNPPVEAAQSCGGGLVGSAGPCVGLGGVGGLGSAVVVGMWLGEGAAVDFEGSGSAGATPLVAWCPAAGGTASPAARRGMRYIHVMLPIVPRPRGSQRNAFARCSRGDMLQPSRSIACSTAALGKHPPSISVLHFWISF